MFVLVFSQLEDFRAFYTSALEYIQQTMSCSSIMVTVRFSLT